ncbi:MAG: insulinase family protein [Candidatus Eremiobacteraeota bacterium]|nr:insulinase family protein [Candidatus Eremiobacteraeota bacterium]
MKETFQKTVLPNGLRIVTERIPQYPSASIGIWVNVGSQDEEDSNRGVSHFLEHLMFKGTPSHSAKEIAEIMDGIGGNLNAFTEKEQTCFYAKVMDKHIPTAMEIMGDMILNSHFPEPEVEREKGVILEEIKMYEDSPDELVFDLMAQTAWKNHPLGLPILGTKESILQTNRQTLRQFVERFYTPEHIIISVAGKVKHEEIVKLTQTYFQFSRRSNHSRINLPP